MEMLAAIIFVLWLPVETANLPVRLDDNHFLNTASGPLSEIMSSSYKSDCSMILLADEDTSIYSSQIVKKLKAKEIPWGYTIFSIPVDSIEGNSSSMGDLIDTARQLRRTSWCVTIVVTSERPYFLRTFANYSVQHRLLEWKTRLVIVTRLPLQILLDLLSNHWTFAMMNTLFLNLDYDIKFISWSLYMYLPYSPNGAQEVKITSWTPQVGLQQRNSLKLFPEKYSNFYGAVVNVTSKPYPPYWIEEEYPLEDGSIGFKIDGTDGLLLHAVSKALNFKFYNVPTASWDEVLDKIIARESFISPVRWVVLPERLERFDLSYVYEFSFLAFCMSKPPLQPQWQSLHYPLSYSVWISILASIILAPGALYVVFLTSNKVKKGKTYNVGMAILEVLRTLLGQNLSPYLPKIDSSRILIGAWILFAFIVGVAYRGNLTAHLTLPKYPPRPETLEELVDAVDMVGGASYIYVFRDFFSKSRNVAYKKFAELIEVGVDVSEGMELSLHNQRMAVTDSHRYMQHMIADQFTKPDGTTQLYIGRAVILPGQSAWAMPHDAPYKANLERSMQAAIEAGLYEKWSWDVIGRSRQESIKRQREMMPDGDDKESTNEAAPSSVVSEGNGKIGALSTDHMQGPIFLLIIGWCFASVSFILEILNGQSFLLTKT